MSLKNISFLTLSCIVLAACVSNNSKPTEVPINEDPVTVCAYSQTDDISQVVHAYFNSLEENSMHIEPEEIDDSTEAWMGKSVVFKDLKIDTLKEGTYQNDKLLYDLDLIYLSSKSSWGTILTSRTEILITAYDVDISEFDSLNVGDLVSIQGVFTDEEYTGFNLDLQLFAEIFEFYIKCAEITEINTTTDQ